MYTKIEEVRDDLQETIDTMCENGYHGSGEEAYDVSAGVIELAKKVGCKVPARLEDEWGNY